MSTDTSIVGIDIIPQPTDTLADRIRRAGQADALAAFAMQVKTFARDELRKDVDAVADATGGGGFTKKIDGIRATLTDPQPKAHVDDPVAFGAWLTEHTDVEVETVERVEVTDHEDAAQVLRDFADWSPHMHAADAANELMAMFGVLAESLEARTETRLPADVIDKLLGGKHKGPPVLIDGDERFVWVDTTTGLTSEIPGTKVTPPAKPQMQVVPDDWAKARDAAVVVSFFGVDPAALEGGAA